MLQSARASRLGWRDALGFLALIFGGFALIAYGVSRLNEKCESDIKESSEYHGQAQVKLTQDGKNRNRTSQEFSASLNLTQAPPQQPKESNTPYKESKSWWDKFKCDVKIGDAVIAWLTWCLAVVGAFQALYLRRSIEDTGKAAEAASQQVELTRNNAEKELRAYIAPERARFEITRNGVRGVVQLRNSGKTMAREVRVRIQFLPPPGFDDASKANANELLAVLTTQSEGKTVLMPNGVWTLMRDIPGVKDSSQEVIALVGNGTIKISIKGDIDYLDVFGNPRSTAFKFVKGEPIRKDILTGDGALVGWDVEPAEEGNDAT